MSGANLRYLTGLLLPHSFSQLHFALPFRNAMRLRPVYNLWDLESASFGCGFWTTLNVVSILARAIDS